MSRSAGIVAKVVVAGVLAATLVAVEASAQGRPAPRRQKAERNQVVNELGRLHQAQLALFRRYATDDDYAGKLDDLMSKRDYRAAAAAAAEAAGIPAQNVEVSETAVAGAGAMNESDATLILAGIGAPSLRELRGPHAALADGLVKTAGHVCFNFIFVKGCVDW